MLFRLGRWIVYERETRTRKPTPKLDALSQWYTMEVQCNYVLWMENFKSKRDDVLPAESCQAGRMPGPVPQKGPPQATGGHPVLMRGARLWRQRVNATGRKNPDPDPARTTRPLNILQWNADGVYNKKVPFTEQLHKEDIDVTCIQETHLNTNHRFTIRGYQTCRLNREGRHKGGVLILVWNNTAASNSTLDTNQQAEIQGANITVDNSAISILNLYGPPDKDLSLQNINVPQQKCLAVGDFNSHSTSWSYGETNCRGGEVEDWQIDSNMLLLNDPKDLSTFFYF